jgi:hypothetical protein
MCGSLFKDLTSHHGDEEFKFSYFQPKLGCLGRVYGLKPLGGCHNPCGNDG